MNVFQDVPNAVIKMGRVTDGFGMGTFTPQFPFGLIRAQYRFHLLRDILFGLTT